MTDVELIGTARPPESDDSGEIDITFRIEGLSSALARRLLEYRHFKTSVQDPKVTESGFDFVTPRSVEECGPGCYSEYFPDGDVTVEDMYEGFMCLVCDFYNELLRFGIPEEDARYILPNACCTNMVYTINAEDLRRIAELELGSCNWAEARDVVTEMVCLAKGAVPVLFDEIDLKDE